MIYLCAIFTFQRINFKIKIQKYTPLVMLVFLFQAEDLELYVGIY